MELEELLQLARASAHAAGFEGLNNVTITTIASAVIFDWNAFVGYVVSVTLERETGIVLESPKLLAKLSGG